MQQSYWPTLCGRSVCTARCVHQLLERHIDGPEGSQKQCFDASFRSGNAAPRRDDDGIKVHGAHVEAAAATRRRRCRRRRAAARAPAVEWD